MSEPVLHLPYDVPSAALVDGATRRLSALTDALGGLWFDASDLLASGGQSWPARNRPDAKALPIFPDTAGEALLGDVAGRAVMRLTMGENTGFRLSDVIPQGGDWTAGLLWHPAAIPDETRSLLAIRGSGRRDNYAFLGEHERGQIQFRDGNATTSSVLSVAPTGWRLVLVGQSRGMLRLFDARSGATVASGPATEIQGATDLLIGCRSARRGMPKSLGAARIGAVWLWPGEDHLRPDASGALREAMADYALWEV